MKECGRSPRAGAQEAGLPSLCVFSPSTDHSLVMKMTKMLILATSLLLFFQMLTDRAKL